MLRFVHHAGQAAFLATEKLFNRAFGEASNPFYFLGAISYYLLWIVVASGLYLYAFFSTGVTEAYQSVEQITHGQRWVGGILRSLHRYASDGMVLTMLLHVVRHFVFDHYRAFRWFSWVSGIVLLWLVYVSGINGYMLPWDRLAQFTVVATAEWLDWLPIFNGTLVRNFITPDAVNDRLFSLLSFLHIGFPLGVLALLWVHTQRVPGAHTNPPRQIAIPLTAALVALSVVKPALSLAPADLASAPTVLAFDWFYLPTLAALYAWGPATLWAIVGGGTLVALALPWLPPKRGSKLIRHLAIRPDNRIVPARPGETVLEAALRENIRMPYDCRNGGCGQCKCTVLYGEVDPGPYQPAVLSDEERRQGKVLACIAVPLGDVEIEYVPVALPGGLEPRVWHAKVASLAKAADDVMIVHLAVEGDAPLHYYAGQYINIVLPDGAKRSFSFATAPGAGRTIELQIRRIAGGRYTTHVFEAMKVGDPVTFEGPLGSFFLREDASKPIVFVAGATGFAPVKSMVEHAFATGLKRRMVLYWGTRTLADMYARDLCERWAREHPSFTFVPVLSEPRPEDHWTGRTGLVHEAILADFPTLAGHQVYACGSVAMVEAAHPAFRARGMDPNDCFSDAFRLAPHLSRATPAEEMVRLGERDAMNTHPVNRVVSYAGQALGYAAFCAVLAYFSTAPVYRHLPPDVALVKLSLQHAGQRKEACHERTPEELAKLAPNMRAASVCPRERVPVTVEIELDGTRIVTATVTPSGLSRDGSSTLYRRVDVPAGRHRIVARLADAPTPGFGYVKETTVELAPGAILLIDFDAKLGGWVFKS